MWGGPVVVLMISVAVAQAYARFGHVLPVWLKGRVREAPMGDTTIFKVCLRIALGLIVLDALGVELALAVAFWVVPLTFWLDAAWAIVAGGPGRQ